MNHRLAVLVMAVVVFAFVLGLNIGRSTAPVALSALTPVYIFSGSYTDTEVMLRFNAQVGYTVKRAHYASSVHGLARGRYAARQ